MTRTWSALGSLASLPLALSLASRRTEWNLSRKFSAYCERFKRETIVEFLNGKRFVKEDLMVKGAETIYILLDK